MNREKYSLYKKALAKMGKEQLIRECALQMNTLSISLLSILQGEAEVEDDGFIAELAESYICMQRLIEMLGGGQKQQLWTSVHQKLDQLRQYLDKLEQ